MRLDVAPEPTPKQRENISMAVALKHCLAHVYEGTVTAATKARRRAASKVARRSRRLNRGRA